MATADTAGPPATLPSEEPAGTVATLGAVAQAFGVSLHTVKKDWRPGGMPGAHGTYDLAEIAEWRKLAQRRNPDPAAQLAAGGGTKQLAEFEQRLKADVRIREAEAAKRERLNRIAEGQMIDRALIERLWAEQVIAARERFKRLPRTMMPRFPRKLAQDLCAELDREVDSILNDLAEWRPSLEDDDPLGENGG